jgi:hypothetical protein
MLAQQVSKITTSALYTRLRDFIPFIADSWDVPFTAKEERARVLFITQGEGAETLQSIEPFLAKYKDAETPKKTRHICWADQIVQVAPVPVMVVAEPFDETPFQMVMKALKPVAPTVNAAGIKTVVARNLPRDINELELRTLFGSHGAIRDLYIPKNTDRSSQYFGTIKGFALVKFHDAVDSTRAFLALTKLSIRGKNIALEFAKEDR